MNHGSIFSGIGGFDLAAQWMGWNNVFHCEWNEFGQRVLKHYWPKAITYGDITKTDFTIHAGNIDILTGGFPCQPYSAAGKRLGKEDDRHLWPEMLRAIREIRPRWVVGENVFGITNWNGGLVFHEVQLGLEAEGYEVQPFVLPACAVNAPHRRDRVWFVAHSNHSGTLQPVRDNGNRAAQYNGRKRQPQPEPGQDRGNGDAANASSAGREELNAPSKPGREGHRSWAVGGQWRNFPTQSPVRKRNDGLPHRMARYLTKEIYDRIGTTSEENRIENLPEMWQRISSPEIWEKVRRLYSLDDPEILFQAMQLYSAGNITQDELSPFSEEFSRPILRFLRKYGEFRRTPQGQKLEKQRKEQFANSLPFLPHEVALAARSFEAAIAKFETWHRNESIKAYGNAIVPQVALQIFKAIQQYENKSHAGI